MAVNLYHDVVLIKLELADADHDICYLNYVETILDYETVTPEIVYRKGNQVCLYACDLLVWVPFTRVEGAGIQTSL